MVWILPLASLWRRLWMKCVIAKNIFRNIFSAYVSGKDFFSHLPSFVIIFMYIYKHKKLRNSQLSAHLKRFANHQYRKMESRLQERKFMSALESCCLFWDASSWHVWWESHQKLQCKRREAKQSWAAASSSCRLGLQLNVVAPEVCAGQLQCSFYLKGCISPLKAPPPRWDTGDNQPVIRSQHDQ